MVNATKYNLFGAVRKYGDAIPWFFDGTEGATAGDEVLFYLTSSNPSSNDEGYGKDILSSPYKRVVFRGVIIETNVNLDQADRDSEYWDGEHAKKLKQECKELVFIKIEESVYDKKIDSSSFDKSIFAKNKKTHVVKVTK